MKKIALSLCAAASVLALAPAANAAETLIVPFTTPDAAVTTGSYSGLVSVTVSGFGYSSASAYNDAFYIFTDNNRFPVTPFHPGSYYQLTFGTQPLQPYQPDTQDAYHFIPAGVPAYNPDHVYSFLLDTGTATPKQLHFGVSDGQFSDNGGSFSISVAAVPEPATWAMMLAGFGALGFALRRREEVQVRLVRA